MPHKFRSMEEIPSQVKNLDLVRQRRRQIVDAAVQLFIEKGFHKATTRQIAKSAGVSIGSLYEYVASKEDILYLVCEAIHNEVEESVTEALKRFEDGRGALVGAIREYFMVCHRMSDHILLIYQETQSLPLQWRKRVLEHEVQITGLFVEVLSRLDPADASSLSDRVLELVAHNICVLGHAWTFRRWFLARHYSIDEYIEYQTTFILGFLSNQLKASR